MIEIADQTVDMTVNRLPARTFRWLGMNETVIQNIRAFADHDIKISSPKAVALTAGEELIRREIPTGMGEDMDRFMKISGAETIGILTPKGVEEKEPVRLDFHYQAGEEKAGRAEIVAGENSTATVIMDFSSDRHSRGVAAVQTKILAKAGAKLSLVQIQRLGEEFVCLNDVGIVGEDGASVQVIHLILGGRDTYQGCRMDLLGKESSFSAEIGYLGKGSGRLDMNYIARHIGPKTKSEIHGSGVLRDQAFKLFRGTIDFVRGAAGAVGNEKEDILLLDDQVVNQTIPLILCGEEDVEGNHGATIGQLDEELLFYLESRGIGREAVYEMMARARILSAAGKIPDQKARDLAVEYMEGENGDGI